MVAVVVVIIILMMMIIMIARSFALPLGCLYLNNTF
jgi:hypothetical protein